MSALIATALPNLLRLDNAIDDGLLDPLLPRIFLSVPTPPHQRFVLARSKWGERSRPFELRQLVAAALSTLWRVFWPLLLVGVAVLEIRADPWPPPLLWLLFARLLQLPLLRSAGRLRRRQPLLEQLFTRALPRLRRSLSLLIRVVHAQPHLVRASGAKPRSARGSRWGSVRRRLGCGSLGLYIHFRERIGRCGFEPRSICSVHGTLCFQGIHHFGGVLGHGSF